MGLVKPLARAAEPFGTLPPDLNAADSSRRRRSAEVLSHQEGTEPELLARLEVEDDPSVREALFLALAHQGTEAAAQGLAVFLGDDRAEMRNGALETLRALPEQAAALLPMLRQSADPDVRIFGLLLAADMAGADAMAWVLDLLQDEADANFCAAAVEVLTEAGDEAALPILDALVDRFADEPFLRFAIELAAGRLRAH